MSHAKDGPMPHVEVPDAAAAFHKLEDAARRLMAVPKKEVPKSKPARPSKTKRR